MQKARLAHRNLVLASLTAFLFGASSVHCGGGNAANGAGAGSGTGGTGTGAGGTGATTGNGGTSTTGDGLGGALNIDASVMDYSAEQIYANDPPPATCDGGGTPPPVGGTPECPSDKNLPGCPCPVLGMTASCWTGLRTNRDHGDCKDGMTLCGGSESLTWGPCTGEVLPVAGATGQAACTCFSKGWWKIDNLEPCFFSFTDGQGNMTNGAISTLEVDGGAAMCPTDFTMAPPDWSTDALQVDCAGTYQLCYTIKAGSSQSPQPTDCVIAQSCVTAVYPGANYNVNDLVPVGDLPGWLAAASASSCVTQFTTTGGYGEMSVNGQSDECENISMVFQHVTYCPTNCGSNCPQCTAGGGGGFMN